MVALIVQGCVC